MIIVFSLLNNIVIQLYNIFILATIPIDNIVTSYPFSMDNCETIIILYC